MNKEIFIVGAEAIISQELAAVHEFYIIIFCL